MTLTIFSGFKGLAVLPGPVASEQGTLLVTESHPNSRILSVSLTIARSKVVATSGETPGKVSNPAGIAVDPTGKIFVADNFNRRIQVFRRTFMFKEEWRIGSADGVAIDTVGNVYVTIGDTIIKRNNVGGVLKEWGGHGTDNGKFRGASGIAVQSNGDLVVVDTRNGRVQKFKNDSQFIKTWGKPGQANGEFRVDEEGGSGDGPKGVAVDSNDNIYVADYLNGRVQKFDPNGNFIKTWGRSSTGDHVLAKPWAIAFNKSSGDLFVSDVIPEAGRIQIFTTEGVFRGSVNFGEILSEGGGGGVITVTVPNVTHPSLHPRIARSKIENAGLRADIEGCSGPNCRVTTQDPAAGTLVPKDSTVTCNSEDTTL